jgi:hypothetical protein
MDPEGFIPRLAGSIALGLKQGRASWQQEGMAEAAHLMVPGSRGQDRKGPWDKILLKAHPQ